MMMRLRVRRHVGEYGEAVVSDQGSALVLALAFLTFFGIVLAVILSLNDTGFRTTLAIRSQRVTSYAIDGAINGAITSVRGASGTTGCPSMMNINGVSVTVTCDQVTGTGTGGGGSGGGNLRGVNMPDQALLTLSTSTLEDGIYQGSNQTFTVQDDAWSNSTINVINPNSAFYVVSGTANAHVRIGNQSGCFGNVTATVSVNCSNTALMGDPGLSGPGSGLYEPLLSTPPTTIASLPNCAAATQTVFFNPGTYPSALDLTTLSLTCNKTFYFRPGEYYFNFQDAPEGLETSHKWVINNANVTITSAGYDPATGTCSTTPNTGVQWVFGGDSHLAITAGHINALCPEPTASSQQISIYGVRSGVFPSTATVTATSVPTSTFSSPNNARLLDGAYATGTVSSYSGETSSRFLQLLYASNSIPPGSTITSASFVIRHFQTDDTGQLRLGADVTPGGSSSSTFHPVDVCPSPPSVCNQTIPLTEIDTLGKLTGLQISYNANEVGNKKRATEAVDSVYLLVNYTPPGYRVQSGCVVGQPYVGVPSNLACPLIQTGGNQTSFLAKGTIYAPRSAFDLSLPNQSNQIIGRGLIARTLRIELPASLKLTEPAIQLPPGSSGGTSTNRKVLFTAKVAGVIKLTSLVEFPDSTACDPDPSKACVLSWNIIR